MTKKQWPEITLKDSELMLLGAWHLEELAKRMAVLDYGPRTKMHMERMLELNQAIDFLAQERFGTDESGNPE